jgi:hypothetical protein
LADLGVALPRIAAPVTANFGKACNRQSTETLKELPHLTSMNFFQKPRFSYIKILKGYQGSAGALKSRTIQGSA